MAHALQLAARGMFTTQPNPRVGCVIAQGETWVGEGAHLQAGGPHAEVFALRQAGAQARGATAYVTLEPCAHHGRTPPCAEALVAAQVKRVVVAAGDPFDQVNGRGVQRLREAGIEVQVGLMEAQARELNLGFYARVQRRRPFVRLKLASSLDGRIALANGASRWVTGAAARQDVQYWRARSSAILSSARTVEIDDPLLTVRLDQPFAPPLRVILAHRRLPPISARLFHDRATPTLLVAPPELLKGTDWPCQTLALPANEQGVELPQLLHALAERGINELHTECGGILAASLLRAELVDELLWYQAPRLLGGDSRPALGALGVTELTEQGRWRLLECRQVGEDLRLRLRPVAVPSI
ncbi:bifunctional diaminohydroxyphosphoribosylaminopyrimidine deaminase/5-amino-6-(5-phosphoribosylamino)uracil reductase RibD [Pseudomarimonas arenosa]|nr:bifunctional diaminohydroxyphosphoribosylaminopyrimidine deaminase/5-amino-6-(5-phosphoribosylamino)uracil reductase RibD [Pseudomarimonas arenosa]